MGVFAFFAYPYVTATLYESVPVGCVFVVGLEKERRDLPTQFAAEAFSLISLPGLLALRLEAAENMERVADVQQGGRKE